MSDDNEKALVELSTPSITTGNPLPVKVFGESKLRKFTGFPYVRASCFSERLVGGWAWRDCWFRPSEITGYKKNGEKR